MYVWSEGEGFRVSMVGGVAYAQVCEPPGLPRGAGRGMLGELARSCARLLDRGLRPRGLILDVRRTSAGFLGEVEPPIKAIVTRWAKAGLRVGLLAGEDAASSVTASSLASAVAGRWVEVVATLPEAEEWINRLPTRAVPRIERSV